MLTITPNYYQKFKCIANRCRHNCCIGWEIDIDDATLNKYDNLNNEFSKVIKSNIDFEQSPHFKLDSNERCPFLDQKGLCDIITNLGKDMLCQICADHPRFRNFYDNYEEIGLGLCCEAAAQIILSQQEKTLLNAPADFLKLPIISFRNKLFNILHDRTLPFEQRIENLLNTLDAKIPYDIDWYGVFNNLEKLDKNWDNYLLKIKDGINCPSQNTLLDTAYEQLVVYLIYRHFTDCQYDDKAKERVMFAALVYKIIKTMNTSNTLEELQEIARMFSCEIEYSYENIDTILSALG